MSVFQYENFFLGHRIMKIKNEHDLIEIALAGLKKEIREGLESTRFPALRSLFKEAADVEAILERNLRNRYPTVGRGRGDQRDSWTRKMSGYGTMRELTKQVTTTRLTTPRVTTKRVRMTGRILERRRLTSAMTTGRTRKRGCQTCILLRTRDPITGPTIPALTKEVHAPPHQAPSLGPSVTQPPPLLSRGISQFFSYVIYVLSFAISSVMLILDAITTFNQTIYQTKVPSGYERHEEGLALIKSATDAGCERALYTYAMTRKIYHQDEEYLHRFTRESVEEIGMVVRTAQVG
ncbi:hypothetical protein Bca4012_027551 [Brassica carinata]|uniref:Uncharacterized protein n=1 Tax=Brassica carinata TaxID=52824 RepID=A0A8X7VKM8_BRACI|nr:hypothetical protein Bca52824_024508 [Brassica carinata]